MKISVLGYGRVGKAIVSDLVKQGHDVTVIDQSDEVKLLSKATGVPFKTLIYNALSFQDLSFNHLHDDLVVNCLPGKIGYTVTKNLVTIGKNVVDISFASEDPSPLKKLAKENNCIVAIDCGVAPGLWNMMLADTELKMDTKSCICYVGGLPKDPKPPFMYKAPYHPSDVLEMYTRESRYLKDGKLVTKPALTDMEVISINGIIVEAFNTDGLRSMLEGMNTQTIIEKTLRYPGTAKMMELFRDLGFFNKDFVTVEGSSVRPAKLFEKLVFPHWEFAQDEKDITLMQVIVDGEKFKTDIAADKIKGTWHSMTSLVRSRKTFKLYDEACDGLSSMARTTGFTATAVVDLLANEVIQEPGLYYPEDIGRIAWNNILHYIESRGIYIDIEEKTFYN